MNLMLATVAREEQTAVLTLESHQSVWNNFRKPVHVSFISFSVLTYISNTRLTVLTFSSV